MSEMILSASHAQITAVILAGGQARRMGGQDKGLILLQGQPMIRYALNTLEKQVGQIIISANRHLDEYAAFGWPLAQDQQQTFDGPLAGIASGMAAAQTPYILVTPCDSPLMPADLSSRLLQTLEQQQAEICVAHDGERMQPVFALIKTSLLSSLQNFLAQGGRKIDRWYGEHHTVTADFSDALDTFININTPQEQQQISGLLQQQSCMQSEAPSTLSAEQALQTMLRQLAPVKGKERLSLRHALGRVLAEDVISPINVPAHRNSAMDGYAIAGSDLPQQQAQAFPVVATVLAGQPFQGELKAGDCVRIMTGAKMPDALDTVVIQEEVRCENEQVWIEPGNKAGQNVRQAGEDLALGKTALEQNTLINPAELGLLASLGRAEVDVWRRLRVAFFSTGDELRSVGEALGEGEIYDSNRYTLYGMLTRLGVEVLDFGVVSDAPDKLRNTLLEAAELADIIITTGGVSVGEADYIKTILQEIGQMNFWKLAIKPGRPLAFGKIGTAHLFGLPGNPVAAMVTFYHFVQPALRHMMHLQNLHPQRFSVPCASLLRKKPGRTEYQRGYLYRDEQGQQWVRSAGKQGAGILSSMSKANCFMLLSPETGNIEPGMLVEVEAFEGLI